MVEVGVGGYSGHLLGEVESVGGREDGEEEVVEEAAYLRDQEDRARAEESGEQPHQESRGGELGGEERDPGEDTHQALSGEGEALASGLAGVVERDEGEVRPVKRKEV